MSKTSLPTGLWLGDINIANLSSGGTVGNTDLSSLLDDTTIGNVTTYSSEKIESRIKDVENAISTEQGNMVKMWQKTLLNVTSGTVKRYTTSLDNIIDKIQVQCYKYIPGTKNRMEAINNFDTADVDSFYHSDNIEFDGSMKIKDTYTYDFKTNVDGFYETDVITKGNFIDFLHMEVSEE